MKLFESKCLALKEKKSKLGATMRGCISLRNFVLGAAIWALQMAVVAEEERPYLEQGRIDYISGVLQAFSDTKLRSIYNTQSYINAIDRNNCQSNLSSLRSECMLNYAKQNCQSLRTKKAKNACQHYSDIVIVNKLSESNFIDKSERYRIAKNAADGDVRSALSARLQQKYARIVTLYSLTAWSDCEANDLVCQATGVDQFCLDYTNRESLSWQYCVGAMLWFMGTAKS